MSTDVRIKLEHAAMHAARAAPPRRARDPRRVVEAYVPNAFLDAIRLVQEVATRHGFRIALIGGFALPFYGVRRTTGDVDFLIDAGGADPLDEALSRAGYERLHRSADVANYRATGALQTGVDVLYARRGPTLAMLDRAAPPQGHGSVPVVDVEGLIGLKLQAIVNDPTRRRQDEADIVALLALHLPALNRALLDEYFALFDQQGVLARFLEEAQQRRG
jgi:hypothetical protein